MGHESIRVLVVEDHHVVRQGLVALLKVAGGIDVVGEAADGVEAITQFASTSQTSRSLTCGSRG